MPQDRMFRTKNYLQRFSRKTYNTWDKEGLKSEDIQNIEQTSRNIGNRINYPQPRGCNKVQRGREAKQANFLTRGKTTMDFSPTGLYNH
jgi:hypothetical protein